MGRRCGCGGGAGCGALTGGRGQTEGQTGTEAERATAATVSAAASTSVCVFEWRRYERAAVRASPPSSQCARRGGVRAAYERGRGSTRHRPPPSTIQVDAGTSAPAAAVGRSATVHRSHCVRVDVRACVVSSQWAASSGSGMVDTGGQTVQRRVEEDSNLPQRRHSNQNRQKKKRNSEPQNNT